MSKVTTREGVNPQEKIDELKFANTDYFDVLLLHYQHVATWPKTRSVAGRPSGSEA